MLTTHHTPIADTAMTQADRVLDPLLRAVMRTIVAGDDYAACIGAVRETHARMPQATRETAPWPLTVLIAREFWRQTPHPAHGYACPPLANPGRNDPCMCGSGRKYKQCCQALADEFELPRINGLTLLLEHLPQARWHELVNSRIPILMVEATVDDWTQAHAHKKAIRLLEPWFTSDKAFTGQNERLLCQLLDAYSEAGHPRKKAGLLARAIETGDPATRASMWQRRASMAADEGDYPAAWQAYEHARRIQPQDPALAHLEVILLLNEGRTQEAQMRAEFWAKQLQKRNIPELDPVIEVLQDLARRGDTALDDLLASMQPELAVLAAALEQAPPITSHYTFSHDSDTQTGPLDADDALVEALRLWAESCDLDPSLAHAAHGGQWIEQWVQASREQPILWNAFEALDFIIYSLGTQYEPGLVRSLAGPILVRAEQLLHTVLAANGAEGKRLEWGWMENRCALNLLGERIAFDSDSPMTREQLARLEWIVLTLNPNDNQGFRNALMRAYLECDRPQDAVALSAQYSDDFGAMRYDRALALFAAGHHAEAAQALRVALRMAPKLAAWLLKRNPRAPKRHDGPGILIGGDEEAWQYRQDTLGLWQRLGALDWLHDVRQASAAKTRR